MTRPTPAVRGADPGNDLAETLEEATGSDDPLVQRWLLDRLAGTEPHNPFDSESGAVRERRVAGLLRGVRVGELAGSIIASQMIAGHRAASDFLNRSTAPDRTPLGIERDTRVAAQLFWVATRQAGEIERRQQRRAATEKPRKVEICWLGDLPKDDPDRIRIEQREGLRPRGGERPGPAHGPSADREDGDASR